MKVIPFKIPKPSKELIRYQVDCQPYFYDKLHQHPEIQLSCILEGEGKLIVGDYIGRFGPGDIFLLGQNVPHVFRSDDLYYQPGETSQSHSIILFFDLRAFGEAFWAAEEMQEVKEFFEQMNGCYRVNLTAPDSFREQVRQLQHKQNLEKVVSALQLVNVLMHQATLQRLNLADQMHNLSEREGKRMEQVLEFLVEESHRTLTLEEVASVANMSREAFCRFFKERTRKTLVTFLNELRLSNACQALLHSDQTIASIAFTCGFANLSHFNRVFVKTIGITPREFRRQATVNKV
ncbi:AraC family transcriptional regulator [Pontibacter amylolyticus]|uniref:AraC family transcriptional regulator n=1 Tax=Pontibacter amylolyticus TaxID=1424080 RepID=A0ABQ1WFR2_9BACT|nr:AraC family transcriptional regulator [Pontibacter amylolyticus]GGG27994.1 AraC family transcriptional regulator [Pontibacter amylolyticus]